MNELQKDLELHRTRNGRLEMDYLSRTLMPRWKMVRIDGVYYDRKALADWLVRRGPHAPSSRKALSADVIADLRNATPYRIFGRAPTYASDSLEL